MLLASKLNFCGLLSFFVIIIISCNESDRRNIEKSASVFDIKQAEASIAQSNQNFMKSFKVGDSLGVANCYTTDAKAMAAHLPAIKGRNDMIHFISQNMKMGLTDFDLNTSKVWGDSSIVAEEGTYTIANNKGKRVDKGKYIVLWKQEGGNWKMFRDIWTTDLPDSTASANGPVKEK